MQRVRRKQRNGSLLKEQKVGRVPVLDGLYTIHPIFISRRKGDHFNNHTGPGGISGGHSLMMFPSNLFGGILSVSRLFSEVHVRRVLVKDH